MNSSSPMANPVFRKLFAAQLVALIGTGLTTIALALLANELAGGNAGQVLGIALAIKMVAYVFLAPLIAARARRFDTKSMLVVLDLARAGLIVAMFFVTATWQVYCLIFLLQAVNAGFTPLFQAAIPRVLADDDQYTKALSLSRLAYELENLLSPLLAGLLLFVLTFNNLFVLNGLAFLVSAAFVISSGLRKSDEVIARKREPALMGISAFLHTPRLRALLALKIVVSLAGAMVIINSVVLVISQMGRDQQSLALAMAAYGLGSIIAAFAVPKLLNMRHDRTVMLAGAAFLIIGLMAGVLITDFLSLTFVWLLLGLGNGLILTPTGRLLKRSSSEENRSAMFAAHFSLSHACWLFAYPLAGWLPSIIGMTTVFIVFAAVSLIATLLAAWLWKPIYATGLAHTHDALDHEHMHIHDEHHRHDHEGWEGPEPHTHPHHHRAKTHTHRFVIDAHHHHWPQ